MFTAEALDKITSASFLAAGRSLPTDVPVAIIPDGYDIKNLEHLQDQRSRFRGVLSTQSLPDFCDYVIDQSTAANKVPTFVDAECMAAVAIFDLGDTDTPLHAEHQAKLILKPTAAYNALRLIAGGRHSQQQLAEWVEDWNQYLKVKDKNPQHHH